MKKRKTAKKVAGTGQAAARAREDKFVAAMLATNDNQTQSAILAGFSKRSAENMGWHLMRRPRVKAELERKRAEMARKFELTQEAVLREVARIAYFDASKCFDQKGQLLNIHSIDEDTRRAIASLKDGEVKAFNKNEALGKAMQYLGLLPRPGLSLKAQMSVAAAEVASSEPQEGRSMYDIGRRIAFVLSMTAEAIESEPVRPPL